MLLPAASAFPLQRLQTVLLGLVALLPGSQETGAEWRRVEPGVQLSYPRDHGAHPEYRTEWWYLTGQVQDEEGRRFGFQFTVFRSGEDSEPPQAADSPLRVRQVFAGHLALCDVTNGEVRFAERLRRGGNALVRASTSDLDLALEDWSLVRYAGDRLRLEAGDPAHGFRLALDLSPAKELVLHGQKGYSAKGEEPGQASAYASWTRLQTAGEIELDGKHLQVTGASWYDREFGSAVLPEDVVGWDWFGLRLEGNRELMLFVLRRADGSPAPASAATWVSADGATRALARADFELSALDHWTSPRTEGRYPNRWRIVIPTLQVDLELGVLVADCELETADTAGVTYWEGPVDVRGSDRGEGYAELTGYAGPMTGRF